MSDTIKNLDSLFRLSALPVTAVDGDTVSYCNPAAVSFFSSDFTGQKAHDIFPRWPYTDNSVISTTAAGINCIITVTLFQGMRVLSIAPAIDAGQTASIPAGALAGMANTITTLRLAADKIVAFCEHGEKQDTYVSILYHNYYKLLRITEQLTTISSLKSGDYLFDPKVIELGAFLSDLVSSVRYLTADSGITLEYEPPDSLITVSADPKLLEHLVLGLLTNSLQHTPAGGTIKLCLSRSGDHAALSVDDNGCGIAPDVLAGVFSLQSLNGAEDIPSSEGGLGLPLASAIAAKHKGTVIIESREGKGTHVRVLLRSCDIPLRFCSPTVPYGNSIPHRALTELSVVLPRTQYTREKLNK